MEREPRNTDSAVPYFRGFDYGRTDLMDEDYTDGYFGPMSNLMRQDESDDD